MKNVRHLQSGNFFDTEMESMRAISRVSGWPMSEVCSFFCRWGLRNYHGKDTAEFGKDLGALYAEALFVEHQKSPEWQDEIAAALEAKNVRSEKGS